MIIFEWEKSVIATAKTWPTDGPIFEFFNFWSDYHESRWVLLTFLIFLIYKLGLKRLILPFFFTSTSVLLADLISRRLIKVYFLRPRPNFVDVVCDTSKCWGFVSSHSSNVAAAATFLCLYDRRNIYWTLPVVLLVGFSRIYLIDHFPLDVLGGFVVGSAIGFLVFYLWNALSIKSNLKV